MRLVVTILFALLASIPASGIVAVLLAEWTKADESYILVFMGIAPVALLACAIYLFAATRGAVFPAMKVMLGVIAVFFILFGGLEFFSAPTPDIGKRGLKLIGAIALTAAIIVIVQGLIFHGRERRRLA